MTNPAVWGLPEQNCVVLYQPISTQAVLDGVDQVSGEATDTLVVYFSGHGLVDPEDDEELLLALPNSDIKRAYRTAVPYAWLRRELRAAKARRKVVILDCCYSGRALGWMGDEQNELGSRAEIEGTCVLTAAARTRRALAPPGERFTAFTGELITTLNDGIARGPQLLDMDTVYQHLAARLRAKNMPTPQRGELDNGGNIVIAVNRAAAEPYLQAAPTPTQDSTKPRADTNRTFNGLDQRYLWARLTVWILSASFAVALVSYQFTHSRTQAQVLVGWLWGLSSFGLCIAAITVGVIRGQRRKLQIVHAWAKDYLSPGETAQALFHARTGTLRWVMFPGPRRNRILLVTSHRILAVSVDKKIGTAWIVAELPRSALLDLAPGRRHVISAGGEQLRVRRAYSGNIHTTDNAPTQL